MKLAIFGATGRMGLSIARLAKQASDIEIVGAVCAASDPDVGRDLGDLAGIGHLGVQTSPDLGSGLLGAEVVIDFSVASAVTALFAACARAGVRVVSGTTNLGESERAALEQASKHVAALWAPNMSRGIHVLAEVVELAVRRLGLEFDVEIVEVHHKKKVDSPSGTAKRLASAVRQARPELSDVYGREGEVGARKPDEMAIFGVRGGDVLGDHTVHLLGPNERLELTHRATHRDVFAAGAIAAARFIVTQPPGLYELGDMMGAS